MKKKIGIMSMQRIVNYGSFLQAYALKSFIEDIGKGKVEFVDYQYESELNIHKENYKSKLKKYLKLSYIAGKIFRKKTAHVLSTELKKMGGAAFNYHADVDTLVIGSDEVFNCIQPYPVGYSRELFGKSYEKKNVISYAASFGYTTINDLKKYGIENEIRNMLSRFKSISVRDKNSFDIIKKLTGMEPTVHLDPVLMYDFKRKSEQYSINDSGYIIVYAYTNRLSTTEEKYIKAFAKRHHKKIYSIGNYSRIADQNIICNPLKVFSYFKNADYVITDTFHGTIFAIKTNSKFCTIIRKSNQNKLTALLSYLGREERKVESLNDIEILYSIDIDYRKTNEIVAKERERAINYLKENI